jgi:hypothetical protein
MALSDQPTPEAFSRPLSYSEAARLLRMPIPLIEQGVRTGELPSIEHGGRLRVDGPTLARRLCSCADWPDDASFIDESVG